MKGLELGYGQYHLLPQVVLTVSKLSSNYREFTTA